MTTPTSAQQSYDPNQLVRDIWELLEQRGLSPDPNGQVEAATKAGALLRSLGIFPGVDPETHYGYSVQNIWGENQDVT